MSQTLSPNEFLLKATACVKVSQPFSQSASTALPEADSPVVKDLGNGLCVVYLVDQDEGLVYVQNRHLTGTKLTSDGLHELGLHNLAERAAGKARMQQHGPVNAILADGMFEASLILLDDLWDNTLAELAPNGFVVALPARDVLAVCDAKSEQGIEGLRSLTQRVFKSGNNLLTADLYWRQNGLWAPYRERS